MSDVTCILSQIESGDPSAAEQLLPLVYEEIQYRMGVFGYCWTRVDSSTNMNQKLEVAGVTRARSLVRELNIGPGIVLLEEFKYGGEEFLKGTAERFFRDIA